jgi:hypothetical protein
MLMVSETQTVGTRVRLQIRVSSPAEKIVFDR